MAFPPVTPFPGAGHARTVRAKGKAMRPLLHSLRYSLLGAAVLAVLGAFACVSGNGGNIGDGCQSSMDCANQYECLAIDDAGACSSTSRTCQQACASTANCLSVGSNYNCIPLKCAGVDNSGVCGTQ
jgi:hypothetical protein